MSTFIGFENALKGISDYICSNGGLVSSKVEIVQHLNEGFGIFAREPMAAGETIVKVPFSHCISAEVVAKSTVLKELFADNSGLLQYPDEVLAIALMHGKLFPHSDCSWSQHIKILPESFNTTIFWSSDELEELKGNNTYHLTRMMNRQIENDFETIHFPLSENYPEILAGVTIDLYKWALSVVYSRSLEFIRSGKTTRCIVPVLDMANHNPHTGVNPTDTFKFDENEDTIRFVCGTDLAQGTECYAVYGLYPNAKLIYNYGFVIQNNPVAAIDLWARLQPTNFAYETKHALLSNSELTKNQTYDFSGTIRNGYVSPALLATIRVIQGDEEDLPHLANAFIGKLVSLRNEMASYVSLRNLIVARMDVEKAKVSTQNTSIV
jgi:protein-histidine N-methyltransferase